MWLALPEAAAAPLVSRVEGMDMGVADRVLPVDGAATDAVDVEEECPVGRVKPVEGAAPVAQRGERLLLAPAAADRVADEELLKAEVLTPVDHPSWHWSCPAPIATAPLTEASGLIQVEAPDAKSARVTRRAVAHVSE